MSQPEWEFVANLGDVNPIDHGGYFVFRDRTGHYEAEAEYLKSPDTDDGIWTVHRFALERCTFKDGILSDNAFHPEFPAWFADSLDSVSSSCGITAAWLRDEFCSDDPVRRARAYESVAFHYGWNNFDEYPLTFTDRSEIEKRYKDCK